MPNSNIGPIKGHRWCSSSSCFRPGVANSSTESIRDRGQERRSARQTPVKLVQMTGYPDTSRSPPDYTAPDNSEIRVLGGVEMGSLAHCTLHPGMYSLPVRHQSIYEVWYVVGGHGEVWHSDPEGPESIDLLWPSVAVDIPAGSTFQFQCHGGRGPTKQFAYQLDDGRLD